MIVKAASVGIVINQERQVLIASNRRHGGWALVGGMQEPEDRSPSVTMSRELFEEAGYKAYRMVRVGAWPGTVDPSVLVTVYYIAAYEERPRTWKPEPGTELKWGQFDDLRGQPVVGDFYRAHFPDGFKEYGPSAVYVGGRRRGVEQ